MAEAKTKKATALAPGVFIDTGARLALIALADLVRAQKPGLMASLQPKSAAFLVAVDELNDDRGARPDEIEDGGINNEIAE